MRRVVVAALCLCACPSPRAPTPTPTVPASDAAAPGPVVYRSIRHAVAHGTSVIVVGQLRAAHELTSTAFVARVDAQGSMVWHWEGRGEWEIAEHVAVDDSGTIVVAGRSSPRGEKDTIWVRAFPPDADPLWTTEVANDAAIVSLTSKDRRAVLRWATFASLDVEEVELDSAGAIARRDTTPFREATDAILGAELDSAEYPEALERFASAFGPLETEAQIYAELRWWVETGGPDEFANDDATRLATLTMIPRQGCQPFEFDPGCNDVDLVDPPIHLDVFSDPCAGREQLAEFVESGSPAVLAKARELFLNEDLRADDPLVDAFVARAQELGRRDLALMFIADETLRSAGMDVLEGADATLLGEVELQLREDGDACDVVATLRKQQLAAGATLDPLPTTFADACEQIFYACADGKADLASMLPPKPYRLRTKCAPDYPKEGETTLDPCVAGVRRTRELPDIDPASAYDQCVDNEIVDEPDEDPRVGNCGVHDSVQETTIVFRALGPGRFVIDRMRVDIELAPEVDPLVPN